MPNKNLALMHTEKERGPLNCELQVFEAKKNINSLLDPNPSFYGGKKTLLQAEGL